MVRSTKVGLVCPEPPPRASNPLVTFIRDTKSQIHASNGHEYETQSPRTAARCNFQFDTVQMPVNVMDAHFRSFTHLVIPEAQKMGLGILGMKSMGAGVILKSKTVTAVECLRYALSQPVSVVITGIDSPRILEQALQVGSTFKPLTAQQISAILKKTAQAAEKGEYELFKTSSHFDSTAMHPQWLGTETPHVQSLAKTS